MRKNTVKIGRHYFRYDNETAEVRMMWKPKAAELREMQADNAEWMEKFGHPLWDGIDPDGLVEMDRIGLSRENWNDPEARSEYLEIWIDDVEEETRIEAANFVKYELPSYQKGA